MSDDSLRNHNGEAQVSLRLGAVIAAVTNETPRILSIQNSDGDTLPEGPLDPIHHLTLDKGLRAWIETTTGIDVGYLEQLYTFGDRYRDPRERNGGPRVVSVGYLALVHEQLSHQKLRAHWQDWYDFLPWEDWRDGQPQILKQQILPGLKQWILQSPDESDRVDVCFGLNGAAWDPDRCLERYEVLYQAGLVPEGNHNPKQCVSIGRAMALDHRRIVATALGRIRGKIKYRPVIFELLPDTFTLLKLQRVAESLAGSRLHKQNFRRLVSQTGMVEATGMTDNSAGGRPAELFRFRREVIRERHAPGVHFSGAHYSNKHRKQ